jgi:hypothetical protein
MMKWKVFKHTFVFMQEKHFLTYVHVKWRCFHHFNFFSLPWTLCNTISSWHRVQCMMAFPIFAIYTTSHIRFYTHTIFYLQVNSVVVQFIRARKNLTVKHHFYGWHTTTTTTSTMRNDSGIRHCMKCLLYNMMMRRNEKWIEKKWWCIVTNLKKRWYRHRWNDIFLYYWWCLRCGK